MSCQTKWNTRAVYTQFSESSGTNNKMKPKTSNVLDLSWIECYPGETKANNLTSKETSTEQIKISDTITVIKGEFTGTTGIVSKTKTNRIEFVCLESYEKIEVASTDVVVMKDEMDECMWGDLVQFVKNETLCFGVVLCVKEETASILTTNNVVKKRPQQSIIRLAKESDPVRWSMKFKAGPKRTDFVEIYDGAFAGLTGVLKHVFQDYAFVYVRSNLKNHGLVACKIQHLDRQLYEMKKWQEMNETRLGETVMFTTGVFAGYLGVIERIHYDRTASVQLLAMNRKTNSSVSEFVPITKNDFN